MSNPKTLVEAIRLVITEFREEDGRVFTHSDVAKLVELRFPRLFREDADSKHRAWLVQQTRRLMRKVAQQDDEGLGAEAAGQLDLLPGHVHRFYCIGGDEDSDDQRWIALRSMRRGHWEAAEAVLASNLAHAQKRLLEHRTQMDVLRPWWEKMPSATTEEILEAMRQ